MKKYIVSLVGIIACTFMLCAHAYDDRGYGRVYYKWHCNHYSRVCHKVYFREPGYRYERQQYRKHVHKKRSVKNTEPKYAYEAPPDKIDSKNIVNVNLAHGTWGAYDENGQLVNSGHVSGGKSYCADINKKCKTVTGTFKVYEKRGGGCKSKIFPVGKGGAPMPYCMFFHQGFAMHGSNAVPNYNASHGCIRMSRDDAQWLNENFVKVGSTRVNVTYDKLEPQETVVSENDTDN
ncbi:MAG: L,D-transpeptidase [Candidatus Berkiella sp.]